MRRDNKGFTLIEVMIALMIFAVISVLAAAGLKTLLRTHEAIRAESNQLEELQIASVMIERNLSQSIDRSILDEQNSTQFSFLGAPTYLEFTHGGLINPDGALLRSTLQRTAYLLKQGNLVQRNWPVLDRTAKTVPTDRILIKNLTNLQFQYMDAKNKYFDTWPQQTQAFPRAVVMTIALRNWGTMKRVFIIPGRAFNVQP